LTKKKIDAFVIAPEEDMPNKFSKRVEGSGRLNKSGFRFNISKECRWSKDTAKALPTYREGYDRIDFSKKPKKEGGE